MTETFKMMYVINEGTFQILEVMTSPEKFIDILCKSDDMGAICFKKINLMGNELYYFKYPFADYIFSKGHLKNLVEVLLIEEHLDN
jgi:hypothetical protein